MEHAALRTTCWIKYEEDNQYPLENIPFGAYEVSEGVIHGCTRIGNGFIDLAEIRSLFTGPLMSAVQGNIFEGDLNKFMALGNEHRREVRETIQEIF
jgi:fumarylacetoacetase